MPFINLAGAPQCPLSCAVQHPGPSEWPVRFNRALGARNIILPTSRMANHEPRQSPRKAIVKRLNLANKTYPMPMRASGATTYHRNPTHNRLLVLDGAWGGIAGATVFEFRMRASGVTHANL